MAYKHQYSMPSLHSKRNILNNVVRIIDQPVLFVHMSLQHVQVNFKTISIKVSASMETHGIDKMD